MLQQYEISDIAVSLRDIAEKLDTVNLDALDFSDKDRVVSQLSESLYGSDIAEALVEEFPYTVAHKLAAYAPDMARDELRDAGELNAAFDKSDAQYALDRIRGVSSRLNDLGYTDVRDVESKARELGDDLYNLVDELEALLQL